MATLSTHVLDTSLGRPAANLKIELRHAGQVLRTVITNADGRIDQPLQVPPGVYDLVFHAGGYLRATGRELTDPPFLDEIVIRFGISGETSRYHVPLLLSPYGYSTYRGS